MAHRREKKLQGEIWAVSCYAQNCFRRSANRNNANNVWNVNTSGNVNTNNAYNANRCAPRLHAIMRESFHAVKEMQKVRACTEPNALPFRLNNTGTMRPPEDHQARAIHGPETITNHDRD